MAAALDRRRRQKRVTSLAMLVFVAMLGPDGTARAQEPPTTPAGAAPIEKATSIAQRASEEAAAEDAPSRKPNPVTFKLGKHPSLHIGSAVKVEFRARVETDLRTATPAIGLDQPDVEWGDRRVGFEGTAFKKIEFEVSRELSDDFEASRDLSSKTRWRDVYLNLRALKSFELEAGRFKVPFGYDALTGETNLDFVRRSLAARVLSPSRDVGLMVHGRPVGRHVNYQIGYFTRDGDNARTTHTKGGRDAFAARLIVRPFASGSDGPLAGLQLGMATLQSHLDNQLGVRGRTVFGDGVFFDRVYVNGRRQRIGFEAAWSTGPVSVSGEYISASDQRKAMGFTGDDLPPVRARAWYVAGTWALTGERKDGRLEPRHPLLQSGWGAIELAARIERLEFDSIIYPGVAFGFPNASGLLRNADRVTTLGVNWYLNRYVKVQSNVVIESIADPQRSPAPAAAGRYISSVFRFQFVL
ncbi:MAG: hypothetical protein HYX76_05160 [Acidobacteria bacterium]|nr:hypothetical protein [Acidobacteriota bacterium]